MKKTQFNSFNFTVTLTLLFWSGNLLSADWQKQGSTSYVTHFMIRPSSTIDVGASGKAIALDMVGTTANMEGDKLMDKMTAQCVALQIYSKEKNYIDGGCVLTDKDGDKIFSTFDTRELDKSTPGFTCGTHIIVGGSGKYEGMSGKEPFNCAILPAAGAGWSGMDVEHHLTYKFD